MKTQIFSLQFQQKTRIAIRPLGFDTSFPVLMKQVPGSRWTPDERCWHIPYTSQSYAVLKRIFGEGQIQIITESQSKPSQRNKLPDPSPPLKHAAEIVLMEQKMILQRYSPSTVKTYKSFFKQLLAFYPSHHPQNMDKEALMKFLLHGVEQLSLNLN